VIAVKWSKKEVETRPFLTWNRKGERVVSPYRNEIDVYIYSWNEYKLVKELYGENRNYYFLLKGDDYLCDESGYRARMFNNIKHATKHLEYILENGTMHRDSWENPIDFCHKKRITNVFT